MGTVSAKAVSKAQDRLAWAASIVAATAPRLGRRTAEPPRSPANASSALCLLALLLSRPNSPLVYSSSSSNSGQFVLVAAAVLKLGSTTTTAVSNKE